MRGLTQRRRGNSISLRHCAIAFSTLLVLLMGPVPAASRLNVLLISIDTLRADHLGCYGGAVKTPAIDALAAQSVLFENAISQVPLTLPSHSTIFTGLYPPHHGVRNNENFVLPDRVATVSEAFRSNGYSTGAVIGSFSLDSSFGVSQGFHFYEDTIGQGHDPEINRHVERRAETVWRLGRNWLEKQNGPWFAFLHFFDPHFPFNPPPPYSQTYDGEIAYTDKTIAQIVQFLKERKWLDTTIIVLLSDHGESLGEHGEDNHGIFLYDATLKVPLMLRIPGQKPGRVPQQVRLVDVAPTIASLAGLKLTASGESLVGFFRGASKDLPAYSESYYANLLMGWAPIHSIRTNRQKWIDAPKPELYDLTRDPKETRNVYSSSSVPSSFHAELRKHARGEMSSVAKGVDEETQEKLASLGYVTGSGTRPVASGFDPKDGIELWIEIESAVRDAQLGKYAESEKRFRAVLKKQPDNVIAQKFLANVLRKQNRSDEAILLMQKALKSELHQSETRLHLAEAYIEKKDYSSALQQVSAILKNDPSHERALTMAAWLESTLKKDTAAVRSYSRLVSVRKLTEEEAMRAAAIHLTNRNNTEAEKYFRLAIQANEKSAPAWKGLGLIHASKQEWKLSLESFVKAGDCESAKRILPQASLTAKEQAELQAKCP